MVESGQEELPLELEFQLALVASQAQQLDAADLRHALLCAWRGWLTERHSVGLALRCATGIELHAAARGFLPFECCEVEG